MATTPSPWQRLRRVFLWTIIVSFSLAAIAGIAVLLGAELGDTGARVIASTTVVGAYGLAMLCCGAVLDRQERLIGTVGLGVSALSLGLSLILIWSDGEWSWRLFQTLLTGITLTVALSFVSLFLALTRYRDKLIRGLIPVTLALFTLATAVVLWSVWEGPGIETDLFGRALGIVLILAVLSGVSTPILSTLRGKTVEAGSSSPNAGEAPGEEPSGAPHTPNIAGIDADTIAALEAQAQRRGISVAELVAPVLKE